MNCKDATMSLGVYLVGALDPVERAAVEAHLQGCPRCRGELDELAGLPSVLDQLSLEDIGEVTPVPVVSERLFAKVAARARVEADADAATTAAGESEVVRPLRPRRRWHVLIAAAAAVVLVGGVSATAIGLLSGSSHPPPSFANAQGSVHMQISLASQATGTGVRVTVWGLPTEERCRLIAVAKDGTRDEVGRWDATYSGKAQQVGSTSIAAADLSRFVLLGSHGQRLVTVPV